MTRARLTASLCMTLVVFPGATGTVRAGEAPVASDTERPRLGDRWRARREAAGPQRIAGPGDYTLQMEHGGLTRKYRVHVPASYASGHPTPVVFSLHGGGGNMDIQANDEFYGQVAKSEQAGFIAVFPNGYSRLGGKLATWNAGNCCGQARDQDIDDAGFIHAVLKRLQAELNVDSRRVFANGMSNGGMMSHRLACELPGVFAAIASVAGTNNTKNCQPGQAISILHIHALDDELELFHGGAGKDRKQVTDFVPVPVSTAQWVGLNGCNATPTRVLEKPGVYCDSYTQCRDGVEVKLCVTASGGHSWPGGKKPRGEGKPSTAISATDEIWEFFKTHPRP